MVRSDRAVIYLPLGVIKIAQLCMFMVFIGFAFTSCKWYAPVEKDPVDPTPSSVQAEDPVPTFSSPEDTSPVFSNGQAAGLIPAFPEAEGHGATALNDCRSKPVVVHQVTNTNSSGSGSLRAALDAAHHSNYDIVIFRTGGLINWSSNTVFGQASCTYIAGQTAPGGGISLHNGYIEFRADDVVIRHLRHRGQGASAPIRIRGQRLILDHLTVSGGRGSPGQVAISSLSSGIFKDITVQNTFIFQPTCDGSNCHSTQLTIAASTGHQPINNVSVHRNALMGPSHRMPKCSAGGPMSVVNNVIYNWSGRASATNRAYNCDFIGNYSKTGPASGSAVMPFRMRDPHREGNGCSIFGDDCFGSVYIADNRNNHNDFGASASNPWEDPNREIGCKTERNPGDRCTLESSDNGPVPASMRADIERFEPLPAATFPVNLQPITDSYVDLILERVGHSRQLNCDGTWTAYGSMHEAPDTEYIGFFYSGGGPRSIRDQSTITTSTPAAGAPCPDTDGDGLPDAWETRLYGSPTGAPPVSTIAAGGYTVIEHYLNGTDPLASDSESPAPRPTPPPF